MKFETARKLLEDNPFFLKQFGFCFHLVASALMNQNSTFFSNKFHCQYWKIIMKKYKKAKALLLNCLGKALFAK
jgi:hypothetical protein